METSNTNKIAGQEKRNRNQKSALILGITGGFGRYVALALKEKGWKVTGVTRSLSKLDHELKQFDILEGDATDEHYLSEIAKNHQVLVYGLNPEYHLWKTYAQKWLATALNVAKSKNMEVIFPGNVYNYNPHRFAEISEHTPSDPVSSKGKIRVDMENQLHAFCQSGGSALIIRAGNYIGQHAPSAWFRFLVDMKPNKTVLRLPTDKKAKHSWAYLPDLGAVVGDLLDHQLCGEHIYHYAGLNVSFEDIEDSLLRMRNLPVSTRSFPWWSLAVIGLFSPKMGAVREMRYLWQHPLKLNDEKLQHTLNQEVQCRSLDEVINEMAIRG
ncbi:NAD-dependent epimerase/dehydratase family protein [Vibrio sp. S9_S30]|uniref:NAD-dependent epimerase/dehydratase family protein n=1 Tax=Vibrio sp. S9_S30 TaxID=2720226 RepID=UPI00167FE794|nr:NAD-dependent epimerase/dehydratase family protein [Vibrio sp. S9_S30]MBD1557222.1 NAD-dependent epimerase/dehydratase family protein [Vibrio sp. S9_S30]